MRRSRRWWVSALPMVVAAILLTSEQTTAFPKKSEETMGRSPVHDAHVQDHWAYGGSEGTERWGMLSPAYMACEAGSHQSPVDISMPRHTRGQEHLVFDYRSTRAVVINNGHTIQVNVQEGGALRLSGKLYLLQQLHFHEPSEHHVDGRAYPMELHLVHRDARGHIAVVGVLLDVGDEHPVLARVWTRFPTQVGEAGMDLVLNVRDLLPSNTHHFTYHGSLTTPPCTEGVQWIVLKEHLQVSREQVQGFVAIIGHNARPIQPLHQRKVGEE